MTIQQIANPETTVREVIQSVGDAGGLFETQNRQFALLPLDDDVLDFLLERSDRFRQDCAEIRRDMQAGKFRSHDDVKKIFPSEA